MPETSMAASNCFKYNYALVSRIANSFRDSSSFDLRHGATIDIDKARQEHELLVDALRRIGVDVIELPCDEKHPDGLFVDDIAIVINGTALICNPPSIKDKPSRQGEVRMLRYECMCMASFAFLKLEFECLFQDPVCWLSAPQSADRILTWLLRWALPLGVGAWPLPDGKSSVTESMTV